MDKISFLTKAVAEKYTDISVEGAGAIKGKNCEIQSIEPITGGNRVTFAWYDGSDILVSDTLDVMDGEQGEQGEQGEKGETGDAGNGIASIEKTGTVGNVDTYTITMTDGTTATFTVTNGGVNVVANPEGVASDSLSKITIGDTIYSVSQGGQGTSDYTALENKPQINSVTLAGNKTSSDLGLVGAVSGKGLSENDYTDADKAIVGGVTSALALKADKSEIPENTSDLTNDSGFITNLVNDLVNYYKKTETYTQTEVDALISAIVTLDIKVVATLPTTDISRTSIYLVPSADPQAQNVKDEYINLDGTSSGWELIGSTAIDLSDYVTDTDLATALADYTTTANLTTLLAGKQDTISDLATIRSGASAGASAYQKPATGIPKTDLASAVQTSLEKADTAVQDISGKADKVTNATNGNFAGFDANGDLTDSGKSSSDFLPSNTPIPSITNCYQSTDTAETALADDDYFPFYDTSASAKRKTLWSNIKSVLKSYFDMLYTKTVANPTGTATGTLTSIGINGDKYDIQGGGASALADLTDVNISNPSDGQILQYDATSQKWVNHINIPEYISITVDIYSAASDTVTFTDQTGQKTATTDTDGHGRVSITCANGDSITFTSSVAKNPDNLSQAYSKTITITEATTSVYVMPDGYVLYWWGYRNNLDAISVQNGWSSIQWDIIPPTFTTNSIQCRTPIGGDDYSLAGVGNPTALTGAYVSGTVVLIGQGVQVSGGTAGVHDRIMLRSSDTKTNPALNHNDPPNIVGTTMQKTTTVSNLYVEVYTARSRNGDAFAIYITT